MKAGFALILTVALIGATTTLGVDSDPARAGAPASPTLYPLLKKDVIVGADAWERRPRMMAAGLGFTDILGVPDADSADLTTAAAAVVAAGGAWNDEVTCPSTTTPPQSAYTSAVSPAQINTAYGVPVESGAGLPVEFSWPVLPSTVDPTDFRVTLNDGSAVSPEASSINPNFEYNERSTVVLIGQFGNRIPGTEAGSLFPTRVEVVADGTPMRLVGPAGRQASAIGMSATKSTSPYDVQSADPTEWTGPRLIAAKLSRISTKGENAPLPFRADLPNDGVALYGKKARFRVRVMTTGGFSPDGVRGVYPTDYRRFFRLIAFDRAGRKRVLIKPGRVYRIDGQPLKVLGLADLGRKLDTYDYCYGEDHDNQIDIVLAGSRRAANRIRAVEIPAAGRGYRPFFNPGGPGQTPTEGVRYTARGPRLTQPITNALRNPLTVTYRPGR